MDQKRTINPRLLALAGFRAISAQQQSQQLTAAEYQDYLSWMQVMLSLEKQRTAQSSAKQALSLAGDFDQESADAEATA